MSQKVLELSRSGYNVQWFLRYNTWNVKQFIEENDVLNIINVINNIQENMPTLKPKLNVLIDKQSDIPRPKLKEFINDNDLNKVTTLSKADIIIVRRDSIKELLKNQLSTYYFVPDGEVRKINASVNSTVYDIDCEVILDKNIEHNTKANDSEYHRVKMSCSEKTGWVLDGYRNKKLDESINFIISLVGTKATVVYDDCLMSTLNKDGLDIDDEIYETLKSMLLSRETDTFNLGIEMLSNINLDNNLFKISLLMNEAYNKGKFSSLSQYSNKNFKALLSYLDAQKIRWNQQWEVYGMSMWSKFKDTEYQDSIKKYIISNINDRFNKYNKDEVDQIIDIVFK
jgi:hypothetical protein